jgi:hypothetical protein
MVAKAFYWLEEHRIGEPHYHFYPYDREKYPTSRLYKDILEALDKIRDKYGLQWRDPFNLWDAKEKRMYIQTAMISTKSFPSENRIHVSVFERGEPLFRELIERLDVEEVENEP